MEKIKSQTHNKDAFLYASSRLLERTSYYGLRSIIVLYMVGESLKMDKSEALRLYGWFTASIIFSQIIGALLGDLLIGNKRSVIIGGIIQALGAFSFCIPSTTGLYLGLFLVVIGGGLYTPNLISNFGKLYLNKTKLLDAGFTLFYFAINIGAFLGALVIGYLGEEHSWNVGFIIAGISMILSVIPILFSKDKIMELTIEKKSTISERSIKVLMAFISVGLFWAAFELGSIRIFDLQLKLSNISTIDIPKSLWYSFSSIFILPISLIAIFLWSYYYSAQFFKLMMGFIFGALSFGILFLIPETPNEQHIILYFIALLFLNISEIHIAPIAYSVLTQYANPKYLAILISLVYVPTKLLFIIVSLFNEIWLEKPTIALLTGVIAMSILGMGLLVYNILDKTSYSNSN